MLVAVMPPLPSGSRLRSAVWLAGVLGLATAGGAAAPSRSVIIRPATTGGAADLAPELARLVRARGGADAARVIELSGDGPADSARVAREARGASVLFTIGHAATEIAGEARSAHVVALGVANPALVKTAGVYVSVYPRLERVFAFIKNRLQARNVGLLFSPSKNREVAVAFLEAAEAQGLHLVPVAVKSPGELARVLPKALHQMDVLMLAVDPLIFDRQSLEFVVDQADRAGKPTLGFLKDLTDLGVTICLLAPPPEQAATAVAAAADVVRVGKKHVDVDDLRVIVSSPAARKAGLDPEALGANRAR
jgi:hypothetical protein